MEKELMQDREWRIQMAWLSVESSRLKEYNNNNPLWWHGEKASTGLRAFMIVLAFLIVMIIAIWCVEAR